MNRRVWALTKKLDQLVQRRGGEILARDLPTRREFVITVRLFRANPTPNPTPTPTPTPNPNPYP